MRTSMRPFAGAIIMVVVGAGAIGAERPEPVSTSVQVAAVQIRGYDKTDVPRPDYDPTEAIVPYIDKAGADGTQ